MQEMLKCGDPTFAPATIAPVMISPQECLPCKKVCSILRAEKSTLDDKTVFLPIVQYTCVAINLEKTVFSSFLQYF